jgi:hypothetical protein
MPSAKVPDRPLAGVVIGDRKNPAVSAVGPRVVNLFVSSVSEDDASLRKPYQKRDRGSPPPDARLKSSGVSGSGGEPWLLI